MQILPALILLQHMVHEMQIAVCPTLLLCALQPKVISLMVEQMLGCRTTAVHQIWEHLNIWRAIVSPMGMSIYTIWNVWRLTGFMATRENVIGPTGGNIIRCHFTTPANRREIYHSI